VGDWGAACGPRPSGGGAAGGTVTVSVVGNELAIAFPGRSYNTGECWEQFPGLSRQSHTAGSRAWRTTCKTGAGDSRQASLVTTIAATDTQIHFDETGQYQFLIQGQNCTASVRRTRTLTLVHRDGDPEPAASAPPSTPALKKPAKEARCAVTGLPERLEVRPSRKLMRPGEEFEFRAAVVDAAGCVLPIAPTWQKLNGGSALQLSGQGKVSIAESAAEGQAKLQATVGDRSVLVEVEIVSRERYDALLHQGNFNAEGESSDAAMARIATSSIGARAGVARDEARGKRVAFIAVIGGLSLALGVLGLLIVRRSRRAATPARPSVSLVPTPNAGANRSGKVCPTCREEYPSEAEFCAADGNRLVPLSPDAPIGPVGGVCPVCGLGYDPGVTVCPKHQEPLVPALVLAERRRPAPITQKICPVCGTQYPGDGQFCGKCGAALVPVN
jgi:hypothetical protein